MTSSIKTALITGAAQRIGAAIARELHQLGYNIIIHYRDSGTAANTLAEQLNQLREQSVACLQADLTSVTDVQRLAIESQKIWGRIDVLVNNASSFYSTPIAQATEADWSALIDSNLKGPFFLSQALSSNLKDNQGCIVNLVDIHSEKPMRKHAIYSIAKAGGAMMTKTLARELAPDIRVNGVSPGAILWPEQETSEHTKKSIVDKIPLQRTGDTLDIARTVAFLVCRAPYITGQIIAVDGGRNLTM
ncbi:MAG: pteridine reductase [Pseudomonadales bacterium]